MNTKLYAGVCCEHVAKSSRRPQFIYCDQCFSIDMRDLDYLCLLRHNTIAVDCLGATLYLNLGYSCQVKSKDYALASTLEGELASFMRENGISFDDDNK